jgi:hypothetical protein
MRYSRVRPDALIARGAFGRLGPNRLPETDAPGVGFWGGAGHPRGYLGILGVLLFSHYLIPYLRRLPLVIVAVRAVVECDEDQSVRGHPRSYLGIMGVH